MKYPIPPFPTNVMQKPGLESDVHPPPQFEGLQYRPAAKLKGKVALITGGDSGIGRSIAVLYAREGATVVISYLPAEESDAAITKECVQKYGGEILLISGNLTDKNFCRDLVKRAATRFGKIDILVHNAGYQKRKDRIEDVTDNEWALTLHTNLFAYFYLAREAATIMKPGSTIIATSSGAGTDPESQLMDYGASKGGINALTIALAKNLRPRGIRVNAVAPGPVWSPLNPADGGLSDQEVSNFGKESPAGRPAQPEEIAPLYVFLASNNDSSYITGEIIHQGG